MATVYRIRARFIRDRGAAWAFAAMLFCFGLAIRVAVDAVLPPGYPFLTFFPSVILVTFLAGLWPGIVTAIVSTFSAWYLFIPPPHTFAFHPGAVLALGFFVAVISVDILVIHVMNTALDRLEAERRRSAELTRQSQVMFSELQHRVSNNLQLVSALLMIQQSKIADPAALKVLEQARARVATLGRLHRMLHDPNQQDVDLARYLRDLCRDVIDAAGAPHVAWTVEADPVSLPSDKLVPLALIVAELISNALEHAFPAGRPGRVSVTLAKLDGALRLAVRDNGPGLPPGFDMEGQTSLGLQIVRSLAAQLGGQVKMETDNGTVASLEFPAD